jgi:hypothetical protein
MGGRARSGDERREGEGERAEASDDGTSRESGLPCPSIFDRGDPGRGLSQAGGSAAGPPWEWTGAAAEVVGYGGTGLGENHSLRYRAPIGTIAVSATGSEPAGTTESVSSQSPGCDSGRSTRYVPGLPATGSAG